jgi:hypothetical protein
VEPASTPRPLVQKNTLRDSLPIDMLLFAVSVLVVAQSSLEVPEGLMNNPVHIRYFSWTTTNFPIRTCISHVCCMHCVKLYLLILFPNTAESFEIFFVHKHEGLEDKEHFLVPQNTPTIVLILSRHSL